MSAFESWPAFIVAVGVVLIALGRSGVSKYFESLLGALGTEHGQRLADRARRRRSGRRGRWRMLLASLTARPGLPPIAPPRDEAAGSNVAPGLAFLPGPFAGRRPLFLVVGPDAPSQAEALAVRQDLPQGYGTALAVQDGWHVRGSSTVRTYEGNIYEQLDAALSDCDGILATRQADYLAVILRLPLTGDFEADRSCDLDLLFASMLNTSRNVWITWMAPIETHQISSSVILQSRFLPKASLELLARHNMTWQSPPAVRGAGIWTTPADAVVALLTLLGDKDAAIVNSSAEPSPEYAAKIQLLLGRNAQLELRARLETIDVDYPLQSDDWRICYTANDVQIELTPKQLIKQNIAYLVSSGAQPQPTSYPTRPMTLHDSGDILSVAVRNNDELSALPPLVQSGRAWLEAAEASVYRTLLRETLAVFDIDTTPGAWAYYLTSIDALLQRGEAPESAFDASVIAKVKDPSLANLYLAEAMEFARVRGDLAKA